LHPLRFANFSQRPVILCLGAHCDDIEIGCGATLVRWAREYPGARFVWVVFSSDEARSAETRAAAPRLLGADTHIELRFHEFRDTYVPAQAGQVKDAFNELKASVQPDLVLTHHLDDRHQDHRLVAELTWNAFRRHLVLEYEIPKYEGDLGQPNLFVPVAAEDLQRKVDVLIECYASQRSRDWFTADTFRALARLRGIECAAPAGFAEAFHGRKLSL
jgi:LmbE family N-acetylglucosaminyl deacetylase